MSKILPVVWHDQRNNSLFSWGTCNSTSIATVLQWHGITPAGYKPPQQLDDFITQQLDTPEAWEIHKKTLAAWRDYNPRNNHYVLKWYMEKNELSDRLDTNPNLKDEFNLSVIKGSIMAGNPIICGGSYRRIKASGVEDTIGHINVIVGFTDTGFVFCDPFGNAMTKYQDPNGDHVEYPYDFCKNAISIIHFIQKV